MLLFILFLITLLSLPHKIDGKVELPCKVLHVILTCIYLLPHVTGMCMGLLYITNKILGLVKQNHPHKSMRVIF